jgi:hypothetical protein
MQKRDLLGRKGCRCGLLVGALGLVMMASSMPAQASTAFMTGSTSSGKTLNVTGDNTLAANVVKITFNTANSRYVVEDNVAISAGAECTQVTNLKVNCPSAGVLRADVDLRDGNDRAKIDAVLPANVLGGNGKDTIDGGFASPGVIQGQQGKDTINIRSGGGDWALGGSENDTITALVSTTNQVNAILGDAGNDVLKGGFGRDTINGGTGIDTISGGRGRDTLGGGADGDMINSTDDLGGQFGPESDDVNCGTGNDGFRADSLDALTECEFPF